MSGRERLLAGADRNLEPVLGRRQRAAPGWVISAVGVVGVVEVDRDVVAVGVQFQIPAGAVGLLPRGGVAERNEELIRVLGRVECHLGRLPTTVNRTTPQRL